jgi:hypothetical protein
MSTSDPKLAALEKSLSALVPVPGRIDRDQLLFRAGQASVRPRLWLWPAATALSMVVTAVLGTVLALRPAPATVERVVYEPLHQPTPELSPSMAQSGTSTSNAQVDSSTKDGENWWASSAEYIKERNLAIRWGAESLPPGPSIASASQTPTVESLLGLPERKFEPAKLFPLKFYQ